MITRRSIKTNFPHAEEQDNIDPRLLLTTLDMRLIYTRHKAALSRVLWVWFFFFSVVLTTALYIYIRFFLCVILEQ